MFSANRSVGVLVAGGAFSSVIGVDRSVPETKSTVVLTVAGPPGTAAIAAEGAMSPAPTIANTDSTASAARRPARRRWRRMGFIMKLLRPERSDRQHADPPEAPRRRHHTP